MVSRNALQSIITVIFNLCFPPFIFTGILEDVLATVKPAYLRVIATVSTRRAATSEAERNKPFFCFF